MKGLLVLVVASLIVVAAAAAFAPASLVDAGLASATEGRVRLTAAQGTVWRGQGNVSADDGRWQVPVAWRVDGAALLRGVASVQLADDTASSEVRGRAEIASGRVAIDGLQAWVPAAIVGALVDAPGAFTGGDVKINAPSLALAPASISGTITADWTNARVRVADLVADLGTLRARLSASGDVLSGPITSEGGTLRVDGTVTLSRDRLGGQLRLTPTSATPPALRKALDAVGPADASGAVTVRIDQTLR